MTAVFKEIVYDTVLYVLGVSSILLLYKNNLALTGVIIAGWLFAVKSWHTKRDITIFVTAAIVGTIAEIFAVNFGAWEYANPTVLGVPVWLPLLWGSSAVFICRLANTIKFEGRTGKS